MARRAVTRAFVPSLRKLIQGEYRRVGVAKPLTLKDTMRASSLPYTCARAMVLASKHDIELPDVIDTNLLLTFDHGSGLHYALQNIILPKVGALRGKWFCTKCGKRYGGNTAGNFGVVEEEFQVLRPESPCEVCKGEEYQYEEQFWINEAYRLTGHNDGFLDPLALGLPEDKGLGVLEVKSISPRRAPEIKDVPDFAHAVQCQTYMWLTGCQWGIILYWVKGVYGINALVEHYMSYDEDTVESLKTMTMSIWEGIETGELPERICTSPDCKRAEECPLVNECFEEQDDESST